MGLAVVGYGIGVCGEDYILIVLNGDDRIRSGGCGNRGHLGSIAANGNGFLGDICTDGGAGFGLGGGDFLSVPDIAHRVVGHIQLELGGEGGIGIHTVGGFIQVGLYGGQSQLCGTGYQGFSLVPAHELVIGVRGGSAAGEAAVHRAAHSSQGIGTVVHCALGRGFGHVGDVDGLHFPHGVEFIGSLVVHDDGSASLILYGSGCSSSPALELVAGGSGEASPHGHGIVVLAGNLNFIRRFLGGIRGIIRIVGQSRECGLIAPDGGEGKLSHALGKIRALNFELVTGIIDLTIVGPAQEHLVLIGSFILRSGKPGGRHDIREREVGIALGILRHSTGAAVGIVSNREFGGADKVRIEGDVARDDGIHVEGHPFTIDPDRPASLLIAIRNFDGGEFALVNGLSVSYFQRLGVAINIHGQVCHASDRGRRPLGVHSHIVGGHGLVKVKGSGSGRVRIPASEGVVRRYMTGLLGRVVFQVGQGCLKLQSLRFNYYIYLSAILKLGAIVVKDVAVPGVEYVEIFTASYIAGILATSWLGFILCPGFATAIILNRKALKFIGKTESISAAFGAACKHP